MTEANRVKVGVVGTGLMGAPMALRLLTAGYPVWAYNRTASKLKPLQLSGATVCDAPQTLIEAVDLVILMLTDANVIEDQLLRPEVLDSLQGRIIVQMGTIAPADSRHLCDRFQASGAQYLEAPVLGSIPEAKSGKLILMVGSTSEQFAQWSPILQCFGPDPLHVGPVGSAAALKLAMNQLIGSLTTAFAQSLGLVQREGIAIDTFMQVVRNSALYAPTFDKKLKRMVTREFADPNFPAKHLLKDMTLFVETAQSDDLDATAADCVRKLVARAVQQGWAEADYSSLFNVVSPEP